MDASTHNQNSSDEVFPAHVDVAIIGGGIGGVAAAVALRHAGFDAHIFERATVLREVGGAVVVRQPSMDLFDLWEVGTTFRQGAVAVPGVEVRHPDTGVILGQARLDYDGSGDAWSALRADVHSALLGALPAASMHLGLTTTEVRNEERGATAVFSDGRRVTARLVVGADGIRSITRRLVSDDELRFANLVVLRSMVPADVLPKELPNDTIRMWGNTPLALVTLPLRGGRTVALDTIIHADEAPEDLWSSEVPASELVDRFAGFDETVRALVSATDTTIKANPVYDRDPLATWTVGSVTLLGDAAHPMAPRMGQGANSAIQDAGALADALREHGLDHLGYALAQYEAVRIPAATAMQLGSRTAPDPSILR